LQASELLSYDAVWTMRERRDHSAKKLACSHVAERADAFCTQLCAASVALATFLTGQFLGRWDSI
jgi:hypothetical protein